MFSFKLYKRKCLVRLMTVLGFGGMVGFCIASCQSPKANPNQQQDQTEQLPISKNDLESTNNTNSVQPETETQAENLVIPNSNDQVKQDSGILQLQKPSVPKKYGALSPRYASLSPSDKNPEEINKSLIELNEIIQSICHPEPGTLIVKFVINNSGDIMNLQSLIGSTLKGSKSEKCILDQISRYRFKNFESSKIPVNYIEYTFKFK